jgi:hypothetical protein
MDVDGWRAGEGLCARLRASASFVFPLALELQKKLNKLLLL